jgi:hypothetical protein
MMAPKRKNASGKVRTVTLYRRPTTRGPTIWDMVALNMPSPASKRIHGCGGPSAKALQDSEHEKVGGRTCGDEACPAHKLDHDRRAGKSDIEVCSPRDQRKYQENSNWTTNENRVSVSVSEGEGSRDPCRSRRMRVAKRFPVETI